MAEWKKVIVSGSGADLTNISASGHIRPKVDNSVDLGSAAYEFKDLYLDGTANIDSLVADTADINGGTIDGATIATSDVTVGAGKTLNVSAGTLTTSAAQNKTIMQSGVANNDADVDFGAFEVRAQTFESDVTTGTAPFVVASTTQVANLNASTLGGADFASPGTIGGTSAGVANFTTLNASAVTSLNGDVNLGNAAADDVNLKGHLTASAGIHISGSATSTGSFGKLFGDGSAITGIAFQIDGLSNDLTSLADGDLLVAADIDASNEEKKITFGNLKAGIVDGIAGQVNVDNAGASTLAVSSITSQTNMTGDVADADELLINDGGSLKRVDFSVFRDAVFADVSGDIGIAAGGSVTIQANSVALGSDTTGNYMTDLSAGTGITVTHTPGEGSTATIATNDGAIVHDNLSGFVANEHIDHSGVTITAGAGMTGGGDITATRTLNVIGGTGVTVNANDVAIGQDVAVTADVRFADVTVDGDLTVKGNTTQVQVANLNVEDPFILVGSGSASGDTGIVFASGSATGGSLFGFDQATQRFVYKQSAHTAMDVTDHGTAEAFASIVVKNDTNEEYQKSGNIRVDESADEIYIYVE